SYVAAKCGASAYENNQSGSVDGLNGNRAGNPSPSIFDESPAPIMKWRVAPGIIVNPGPAPRIDPSPVSFTIRHPARGHPGEPDVTVFRIRTPIAIVIEVFVADHIARAVTRGPGLVRTAIAGVTPVIKLIRRTNLFRLGIERTGAGEDGALTGT